MYHFLRDCKLFKPIFYLQKNLRVSQLQLQLQLPVCAPVLLCTLNLTLGYWFYTAQFSEKKVSLGPNACRVLIPMGMVFMLGSRINNGMKQSLVCVCYSERKRSSAIL